jgi:Holliday junction resolvase RusA-like endonuclease
MTITVPLLPPSANHYKRGNYSPTAETIAFRDAVALLARGQQVRPGPYRIKLSFTLPPKAKGDLDNFLKVAIDSCTRAGVIDSDAKVTRIEAEKSRGASAQTKITVEAM